MYRFAWPAVTKYHTLGTSTTDISLLTILAARSLRRQQGWGFQRPVSVSYRWPLCRCALSQSFLRVCYVCVFISSSHRDTSHTGSGPAHATSFYFHRFFKGLSLNTVTMGARASTYKFAGNTVLSTTVVKANIKGRFYIVAAGTFSTKGLWEYKR